jgi:hypothetical protein
MGLYVDAMLSSHFCVKNYSCRTTQHWIDHTYAASHATFEMESDLR